MSEVVTPYSRTRTASKKTFLIIFCILFVILSGVLIGCCVGLAQVKHHQQMIINGKTATAVIYSCGQDRIRSPYACSYKYIDENGLEYWGILQPIYKTKQEAEQHIGEEIEIYIDGNGESFPVGEKPNIGYAVTWVIISIILVCADTVGIVITSIKIHKSKQKQA